MTGSGGLRARRTPLSQGAQRRAEWLLLGRLVLTGVSFGIAAVLEGPRDELSDAARVGLFWTVALAFGATAISATLVRRLRNLHRFAAVQIALDVSIVTALVYFSGSHESVFAFLYVVVTVYGALLFERWGAFGAATLSAAAYLGVLAAANIFGPVGVAESFEPRPWSSLGAVWGVQVGALFLVGALATVLSRELRRTGQALENRTDDLIRLRNLHERTVESLMSGLLTTNPAGAISYFNPEAEEITGWVSADAVGRDVDEVIPGVTELILEAGAGPRSFEPRRARMRYRNEAGQELHLGMAGSILWDEDGEEAGHVLIFQDVTEVVAMERQLRRSERLAAVGEMSAKMAHEIRNPLAAISGSVQVMRTGKIALDPECDRLMDIVVREADRLNGLIQDFLQYARPRPASRQDVLLGLLVEDVIGLFGPSLPENVELVVDPLPNLVAPADPSELKQLLWNLFLNAVQAMPDGGQLRVSLGAPERTLPQAPGRSHREGERGDGPSVAGAQRWAEIMVADTGAGIPLEAQEQIFEPFFTTKKEGSGLGLATVHRIVESHRGMLQVDSCEGQGTTFRILLPGVETPEPREESS
jgi:two-component system sensor histidine kinase PilS (NtrC family)